MSLVRTAGSSHSSPKSGPVFSINCSGNGANEDILASITMLAFNPAVPHPDPNATSRELLLWEYLAKTNAEVRDLRAKVNSLLEMNIRYAEQLHHALDTEAPRKRTRGSSCAGRQSNNTSDLVSESPVAVALAVDEPRNQDGVASQSQVRARARALTVAVAQPQPQSQMQMQMQVDAPTLDLAHVEQPHQHQPQVNLSTPTQAQPTFLHQPFQPLTFQQHHPTFQALQAAQQHEQLQRRINSALYMDHQNQQRFRSVSSSSISLQQALAQIRGFPVLGPGFRDTNNSNNSNTTALDNMISQQVMQCTAAMSSVATAPVVTSAQMDSIHQLIGPSTNSAIHPPTMIPLSAPIMPIGGVSQSLSSHTAPSLTILSGTSAMVSGQDKHVRQRSWRSSRPDTFEELQSQSQTQSRHPSMSHLATAATLASTLNTNQIFKSSSMLEQKQEQDPDEDQDEDQDEDDSSGLSNQDISSTGAIDLDTSVTSLSHSSASISPNRGPGAAAATKRRMSLDDVEVGVPEQIPSIGQFDSLRQLYDYKELCRSYDSVHGSQWRGKMESKRRQNWSRISAVYNRILQMRGPGTTEADIERALKATVSEMESFKMTLTRYSQLIRKRLNDERRSALLDQSTENPDLE
ncbi:hypothetical protein GGF37_004969 [Kickxella alabastrina]|nr:hypothetical protein GGF37_004969 [Kickxella alabastrina]